MYVQITMHMFVFVGKEKRVWQWNIRKKKPDVKVAYLTLVRSYTNK